MTANLIENLRNIWKSMGWCPQKAFEGQPQKNPFPGESPAAGVAIADPGRETDGTVLKP